MTSSLMLTAAQAVAVRTAIRAASFAGGAVHIDFGDIDVHALLNDDWIKVRSEVTRPGYEEHKGLDEFERRYGLQKPTWALIALARDFESLCELNLEDARNLDDSFAEPRWTELLGRCRTAIAEAGMNFDKPA
jgi:hypothetical protein